MRFRLVGLIRCGSKTVLNSNILRCELRNYTLPKSQFQNAPCFSFLQTSSGSLTSTLIPSHLRTFSSSQLRSVYPFIFPLCSCFRHSRRGRFSPRRRIVPLRAGGRIPNSEFRVPLPPSLLTSNPPRFPASQLPSLPTSSPPSFVAFVYFSLSFQP